MEEQKKYKVYKIIMLVVLVAFITFLLTSIIMYQKLTDNIDIGETSYLTKTLSEYETLIKKEYLRDVDEEKVVAGAIKGYVDALGDQYTEYITKEDMEEYMEDTLGNFVGVGIYMVQDTETNKIMVLAPIKGSPAEKAGILPGDYIISADGVQYSGEEMTIASSKIKGEEGTKVTLEILRGEETLTFELVRENIKLNPVSGKVINGNIGYIEFSSFDVGTAKEFKAKFEELKNEGIKSLIIDLRNNGGGIVDETLTIADYILEKDDVIMYEVNKKDEEVVRKSKSEPIIDMPIILLTNENTASSSEILVAALKENERAKIVGTKTFGKGVIQKLLQLPDGSGLKITSEEYLTPKRTQIDKNGIEPDEEVVLPSELQGKLEIEESQDTQLQKAIEMAK